MNLADIDDGIAIYFDREKTQGTTFSKYKNFQLDDSPTVAKDAWVNGIVSFEEVLSYATYTEIKNDFLGTDDVDAEVPTKVGVSPNVETTQSSETVDETEITKELASNTDIDAMDRDELEALASLALVEDFEESEIEEMGTKKLRRLVKEAVENKVASPAVVKEETTDPREILKQKLRERVK